MYSPFLTCLFIIKGHFKPWWSLLPAYKLKFLPARSKHLWFDDYFNEGSQLGPSFSKASASLSESFYSLPSAYSSTCSDPSATAVLEGEDLFSFYNVSTSAFDSSIFGSYFLSKEFKCLSLPWLHLKISPLGKSSLVGNSWFALKVWDYQWGNLISQNAI